MRRWLFSLATLVLSGLAAHASVRIEVDKDAQRMTVLVDNVLLYRWPVSTGRLGYATPSGQFIPSRMEREHFSKEWDDAPMPYSIFFTAEGHAIHGTRETKRLGRPVSHGCIRLSPANAARLFALVGVQGLANTQVVITGAEAASGRQSGHVGVTLGPMWQKYFQP